MHQGTKLLFYDSKSDVLLLDIPGAIPDAFGAWKLGFDARTEVPQRAVVIHHPVGNIARISTANSSCALCLTMHEVLHCIAPGALVVLGVHALCMLKLPRKFLLKGLLHATGAL